MKTFSGTILAALITLGTATVHGQFGSGGGMGAGPNFGGSMAKLFGETTNFTANIEVEMKTAQGPVNMPGKMAYADGKSRLDTDLTQVKSAAMPPGAADQLKAMNMDKMVMVSRPDKKLSYLIYPGLEAYVQMDLNDPDAATAASDYKLEMTELGKETIDGHACIKNKAVVTDSKGKKNEATVWNATDMKKFPIKIEQSDSGNDVTMIFKEVKFVKPDSAQFDAPAAYTKYDNMQGMLQQIMMKRLGGPQPDK